MFETFETNTHSFNFTSSENRSASTEIARVAREILNDLQGSGRPSRLLPRDVDNPWVAPHELTYAAVWNWYQRYYYNYWDEAQADSIQASLAMRRDGGISELLRHRQLPTCALPYTLEADDPDDNEQVSVRKQVMAVINRIPYIQDIKLALLEAIFYGKSGVQLVWGSKKIAGHNYVTVLKHKPVNGDKIVWDYDDTPGVLVYKGASLFSNPEYRDNIKNMDKGPALMLRPKWLRNKFIIHEFERADTDYLYESQKGVGIHGTGMRDRYYWTWNMRMELLGWQLDALQRVGANGMLYAFYPTGDAAARSAVLKALGDLVQNNIAAFPKGMMEQIDSVIGRIEPSPVGYDVLFQLMTYLDDIMRRGFLGQNLSSQSAPTGLGSGVADLQAGSFENIILYDAGCLSETLDEQLIEPIFLDNLWQYKGKMVRGDDLPFGLRYKIQVDRTNVKDLIQAAQTLAGLGVPLDMDNLRDMAGLSPPRSKATTLVMQGGMGGQTENQSAMQSELGHDNKMGQNGAGKLPLKRDAEQFAMSRRLHYTNGESKPLYIPVEGHQSLDNWLDEVRAELANVRSDDLIAAWHRNKEVFVSLDSGTPIKVYRDLSNSLDVLCGPGKYKITVNRRPDGDGWKQIDSSKFEAVPEFYVRDPCGDSSGGFEPGNDCAGGGKGGEGGGTATKTKPSKGVPASKAGPAPSKKSLKEVAAKIEEVLPEVDEKRVDELIERIKKAKLISPKIAAAVLGGKKPEYLDSVEGFLESRRKALLSGRITTRAVAKALMITVASQGASSRTLNHIRSQLGKNSPFLKWLDGTPEGRWFRENGKSRMKTGEDGFRAEDITAGWFLTKAGRKALDNLDNDNFKAEDWAEFAAIRKTFNDDRVNTLGVLKGPEQNKKIGLSRIKEISEEIKASKGNPKKITDALFKLRGISVSKIGFIKHFMGLGETATADGVEINFWLTGKGRTNELSNDDEAVKLARDIRDYGGSERVKKVLVQRIHGRMKELSKYMKDTYGQDVSQHILHHWLWDVAKGEVNTHFAMYSGFSLYRRLFYPEIFASDDCGTGKGGFQLGNRCASNRAKLAKRVKRERSKEQQSRTRSTEQLHQRHARQHEKLSRRYEEKRAALEARHASELEKDPHTNRNRHAVEKAVLNEHYRKRKEALEKVHEHERGFHHDTHKRERSTFREWLKSKIHDAREMGFKHLPEMLERQLELETFERDPCGDSTGGFEHGNTCASGGRGGDKSATPSSHGLKEAKAALKAAVAKSETMPFSKRDKFLAPFYKAVYAAEAARKAEKKGGAAPAPEPEPEPKKPIKLPPALKKAAEAATKESPPRQVPKAKASESYKPTSKNVSQHFEIPSLSRDHVLKRIGIGINAIDNVHSDGEMPPVRVAYESRNNAKQNGTFDALGREIYINNGGSFRNSTFTHEVGHMLDYFGLGTFQKNGERWTDSPESAPLLNAIHESKNIQWMKSFEKTGLTIPGVSGLFDSYSIKPEFFEYQLRDRELFARAYAQYISLRSEDKTLQAEMKFQQTMKHRPQWPDDEFEPIAAEFDKVFKDRGWLNAPKKQERKAEPELAPSWDEV